MKDHKRRKSGDRVERKERGKRGGGGRERKRERQLDIDQKTRKEAMCVDASMLVSQCWQASTAPGEKN